MAHHHAAPPGGAPEVLASPAQFAAAAEALAAGHGPFAIDTERASAYRYDDRAFLIQIRRSGSGTFLLAPEGLRPQLRSALSPVLNGSDWIVHAAVSDLPCLAWLGLYPGRLFDTELAARMCGFEHPNLGEMVSSLLGVELDKGYSDADWSQPNLSAAQRSYAALDVEYLDELAEELRALLEEEGKGDWAEQEFAAIVADNAHITAPPAPQWRELKGVSTLRRPSQLGLARALFDWRDKEAKNRDVAPGRVLPNRVLVDIARQPPRGLRDLGRRKGFPRRKPWIARAVLGVIGTVAALDSSELPAYRPPSSESPSRSTMSRVYPEQWDFYTEIRDDLAELGQELGMAPELLLKPSLARSAVWAMHAPPSARRDYPAAATVTTSTELEDFLAARGARPWQLELCVPLIAKTLKG